MRILPLPDLGRSRFAALFAAMAMFVTPAAATADDLNMSRLIRAIEKGSIFAEGTFMACMEHYFNEGLTLAQIKDECDTQLSLDGDEGFGSGGVPNFEGIDTSVDDPGTIQSACKLGDETISQPSGTARVDGWGTFSWGDGVTYEQAEREKLHDIALAQRLWETFKEYEKYADEAEANHRKEVEDAKGAVTEEEKFKSAERVKIAENEKKIAQMQAINAAKLAEAADKKAKEDQLKKSQEEERKKKEAEEKKKKEEEDKKKKTGRTVEGSACEMATEMAQELLRECNRTGWKDYRCQALQAKMQGCPDPALIRVDPEQGYTCGQPQVDPETFAKVFELECAMVTNFGPDNTCTPPKKFGNAPGLYRSKGGSGDLCNNPFAYVDPEGAGCIRTIQVGGPGGIGGTDIDALIIWALGTLGGPVVVIPRPAPPAPGTVNIQGEIKKLPDPNMKDLPNPDLPMPGGTGLPLPR